ncbi:hypothetical protein M0802_015253 [Mischocyttarus mexicanus]|nr:hypothetical protein M0802_015253 [Mischocyttarus mexicanus]
MKENIRQGLPRLFTTFLSSSLIFKYLFIMFLLIEQGKTDMEDITKDPIIILQNYLKYFRTIYETYNDEIQLSYCWADYILGTSDIRSDFISSIIDKELMQFEKYNYNNNNNVIGINCDKDSLYCNNYVSYENNTEYDVNVDPSNKHNHIDENNITLENNLLHDNVSRLNLTEFNNNSSEITTTTTTTLIDKFDYLNNQSLNDHLKLNSSKINKRSTPYNTKETITEPYIKSDDPNQGYYFYLEPKVLTSLKKKKLENVNNESLSLKDSDVLKILQFLSYQNIFDNIHKIRTKQSLYLDDLLQSQTLRKYDRNEDTTKKISTIWWSLFDNKSNNTKDKKAQVQDLLLSAKEYSNNRNKRSPRSILSGITENPIFITVYRTLTEIFRLGQLIIEIVDSSVGREEDDTELTRSRDRPRMLLRKKSHIPCVYVFEVLANITSMIDTVGYYYIGVVMKKKEGKKERMTEKMMLLFLNVFFVQYQWKAKKGTTTMMMMMMCKEEKKEEEEEDEEEESVDFTEPFVEEEEEEEEDDDDDVDEEDEEKKVAVH